jgi:hypothetical protein
VTDFEPLNPEPIDPRVVDAASGSVFTGDRKGMSRWTPQWGGRISRLDVILLVFVAVVVLVIFILVAV